MAGKQTYVFYRAVDLQLLASSNSTQGRSYLYANTQLRTWK